MSPRQTPLYAVHRAAGARFVEFGGWSMPVQYEGILAEHRSVRGSAGLFDVSHMGEIEVRGPGALELCQRVTTNDASRLEVGRAQYTIWCREDGGTIDDTILYRLGPERFLFCVNAANASRCLDWIREQAHPVAAVEVADRSDDLVLIAVQGPAAAGLIDDLGSPGDRPAPAGLPRFGCCETEVAGIPLLVARTGYTGEDGFELFVESARGVETWEALAAGDREGRPVRPIGLGARDTLRLEAGLPLYGHELSAEISPLEAGVGWAVKLDKGPFLGRDALRRAREAGLARRLIGLALRERGIARAGHPVRAGGRAVGTVTSGTRSPSLDRSIALALVATESLDASLAVEIRGKTVAAERVDLPFYRRPGKTR